MTDYRNSQISAAIDEYIHSDRDRQILRERLINGRSFAFIAEEFEMSDRQIKRIIYKLQGQLFGYLSLPL